MVSTSYLSCGLPLVSSVHRMVSTLRSIMATGPLVPSSVGPRGHDWDRPLLSHSKGASYHLGGISYIGSQYQDETKEKRKNLIFLFNKRS